MSAHCSLTGGRRRGERPLDNTTHHPSLNRITEARSKISTSLGYSKPPVQFISATQNRRGAARYARSREKYGPRALPPNDFPTKWPPKQIDVRLWPKRSAGWMSTWQSINRQCIRWKQMCLRWRVVLGFIVCAPMRVVRSKQALGRVDPCFFMFH